MPTTDKKKIDDFELWQLDEICSYILIELDELKGEFEEILKFYDRHKRLPLNLSRSTRCKSIDIEKLVRIFRKKSIEHRKEVAVKYKPRKSKTDTKKNDANNTFFSEVKVVEYYGPRHSQLINFSATCAL